MIDVPGVVCTPIIEIVVKIGRVMDQLRRRQKTHEISENESIDAAIK